MKVMGHLKQFLNEYRSRLFFKCTEYFLVNFFFGNISVIIEVQYKMTNKNQGDELELSSIVDFRFTVIAKPSANVIIRPHPPF